MSIPPRFIILGAGANKAWKDNTSLAYLPDKTKFIDWQLKTAEALGCFRIDYVAGFQVEALAKTLPSNVHITVNPIWETTGPLYSLQLLDFSENQDLYICYSDILIAHSVIDALKNLLPDTIGVLVDTSYPGRYDGATHSAELVSHKTLNDGKPAEFLGFLKIPASKVSLLKTPSQREYLAKLLTVFETANIQLCYIDIQNSWCDLNIPTAIAKFILKNKAHTLQNLSHLIKKSDFLDQISFSLKEWQENPGTIVDKICTNFHGQLLAIRSSALTEDGFLASNAGAYVSHLKIPSNRAEEIIKSIHKTFASYEDKRLDNLILVQPFLENVVVHGVVFTRTHNDGPYYVINYQRGADTEAITAGTSISHETYIISRFTTDFSEVPNFIAELIEAIREIEDIVCTTYLDIEFAICQDQRLYILQVRPQVQKMTLALNLDKQVHTTILAIEKQVQKYSVNKPNIWAVMPDWNPAEIIGRKPHMLALSLYEFLVTNETWAIQRAQFGYKNLGKYPLMRNLGGLPYIDVRASFTSFVPEKMPPILTDKIVGYALEYLRRNPHFHDKVEFEVMPTCYRFDFKAQYHHIFSELSAEEYITIENLYKDLTKKAIESKESLIVSSLPTSLGASSSLENIFFQLNACKDQVLFFAHQARRAFIATNLLNSLVAIGVLSKERLDGFYRSINTVSKTFSKDAYACKLKEMSRTQFVEKYGHLRPGTYDITADRYSSRPEVFIDPIINNAEEPDYYSFSWNPEEIANITIALSTLSHNITFEHFECFLRNAIESREYSKFVFTKNLSDTLENLADFGATMGIIRSDLSHLHIGFLEMIRTGMYDYNLSDIIITHIEKNKENHKITERIELPVIFSEQDKIGSFLHPNTMANFISQQTASAESVFLEKDFSISLKGKIVLIKNADPGYDSIFSEGIKGFITMFGGVNSHMAVRAAEFGMPAAIGVGEKKFQELLRARIINLDCAAKKVDVVQ